jgi:hypothetical protein
MKRHRIDSVSLVFGLLFLAVASGWLFTRSFHVSWNTGSWTIAVGLIIIGVVGLIGALRRPDEPEVGALPGSPAWSPAAAPAVAPVTAPAAMVADRDDDTADPTDTTG